MTDDEIPLRAKERAVELANGERACPAWRVSDVDDYPDLRALARYIAAHEDMTDPDVLEAREVLAKMSDDDGSPGLASRFRSGEWDHHPHFKIVLDAIKRIRSEVRP